ncbi:MAG: TIM barrel protein [candidate division WS1 bacterium]|nr:TIM barrel protein [candidate division WS1 bacterium]
MAGRFRIALHLITWRGAQHEHPEDCFRVAAECGYDGVEGVRAESADELVELAALAAEWGLQIVNVATPDKRQRVLFNCALGNDAAEVGSLVRKDYGGEQMGEEDFRRAAADLDDLIELAMKLGMAPFHHAHRGTIIETAEDVDMILRAAPGLQLLLDTGHLLACGADPLAVLRAHPGRIGHVHLKDFWARDPRTWDNATSTWMEDGDFEELGKGNFGFDIGELMKTLDQSGYQRWIGIEQDRSRRDPAITAKANRDFLRTLGY